MFKKIALLVATVLLFSAPVFADIFGTTNKDLINIGRTEEKATAISVDSNTILSSVSTFLGKLGTLEGVAYDFNQSRIINQVGATVITFTNKDHPALNIAIDVSLLNTMGAGVGLDYNLGSVLPVKNIPFIQYFQYLHINGGYGYDFEDKEPIPFVGALFKLTF